MNQKPKRRDSAADSSMCGRTISAYRSERLYFERLLKKMWSRLTVDKFSLWTASFEGWACWSLLSVHQQMYD